MHDHLWEIFGPEEDLQKAFGLLQKEI